MTTITCYGGANEIGGNKILLEDKDAKIYLDFGQSFDFGEDYFYEFLQPRSAHGLEVYFEFGLIPKVPRLYSKSMLELTELKHEKPDIDAILISHSHSDHCNHIQFLDESIPIYIGHGTHKLMEAYAKLYPGLFKFGDHQDFRYFKSGDKIKIKHLEIEPIHVDHSVPGAYGFIIHTSKGSIVYTGDFRMHGPMGSMTREFMETARAVKPYVLITEGTRMASDPEHNHTEAEIEGRVEEIVRNSKGIVFVYFSMSNFDRFLSVYHAAVKNGRKMVIDSRFAYILDTMKDKIPALPDVMTDQNMLVYYKMCKSGTFCAKDYYEYERKYLPRMITYREISANQVGYVLHMSFNKLMELVYIHPKDADYIYSSSEHFLEGEDNKEEREVLENWMKHFGVKFHKAHCSGHASRSEILELVRTINSQVVIPIHTQCAKDFKEFHGNVKIPEKEGRMEI